MVEAQCSVRNNFKKNDMKITLHKKKHGINVIKIMVASY